MIVSTTDTNGVEILTGENDHIKFQIAPSLGGKIVSIYNKAIQREFLWSNTNLPLEVYKPGAEYDPHFWGGIDELIPNDIPEKIDSISYPDHGELWTTSLKYEFSDDTISVYGQLPSSGLFYKKTMYLASDAPIIYLKYKIRNESSDKRNFLWKLHAALAIEQGDELVTSAKKAKIVYPETARFKSSEVFKWPEIENCDVSKVPAKNNSKDFFYLYDIENAEMKFVSDRKKHLFCYSYDKEIFPYQWYFASYGGFLNHYTVILEPSTSMPVSVNEAMVSGQCSVLMPGEEINTVVSIYAGENI